MPLRRAVISLFVLGACGQLAACRERHAPPAPPPAAPPDAAAAAAPVADDLPAARAKLAGMIQQVVDKPFAAYRWGIVEEPFGTLPHDDLQAYFNTTQAAMWSCFSAQPDGADLGALVRYDAAGHRETIVLAADATRRPTVEACVDALIARSPAPAATAPSRLYLAGVAFRPRP